ncbi:protein of unknown function [Burkholderia multivorans]
MRIRLLDDNLPARLNELARVHRAGGLAGRSLARCPRRNAGTGAAQFWETLYCMFIQFSMTVWRRRVVSYWSV